jgi:hypothetical protein
MLVDPVKPPCLAESRSAAVDIAFGVGLSRTVQCRIRIFVGDALGVRDRAGRRLPMQLGADGLWRRRAAFRTWRADVDEAFKFGDLRGAGSAMGDGSAAKKRGARGANEQAAMNEAAVSLPSDRYALRRRSEWCFDFQLVKSTNNGRAHGARLYSKLANSEPVPWPRALLRVAPNAEFTFC